MLGEPLRTVRPAFRVRSFRVTGYLRQDLGIRLSIEECGARIILRRLRSARVDAAVRTHRRCDPRS